MSKANDANRRDGYLVALIGFAARDVRVPLGWEISTLADHEFLLAQIRETS